MPQQQNKDPWQPTQREFPKHASQPQDQQMKPCSAKQAQLGKGLKKKITQNICTVFAQFSKVFIYEYRMYS